MMWAMIGACLAIQIGGFWLMCLAIAAPVGAIEQGLVQQQGE